MREASPLDALVANVVVEVHEHQRAVRAELELAPQSLQPLERRRNLALVCATVRVCVCEFVLERMCVRENVWE